MCVAKLIDGRISIPEQLLRGGRRTDRTASEDANCPEKEATGTSEARLRDGTFPIADLGPQSIDDRDHSHLTRRMKLYGFDGSVSPLTIQSSSNTAWLTTVRRFEVKTTWMRPSLA